MLKKGKEVLPLLSFLLIYFTLWYSIYLELYLKDTPISHVPQIFLISYYLIPWFMGLLILISIYSVYNAAIWSTVIFLVLPLFVMLLKIYPSWVTEYKIQDKLETLFASVIIFLLWKLFKSHKQGRK